MRSKMLLDMSQDRNGWRPVVVSDPESGEQLHDRCMVSNGKDAKLIIVEGDDKDLDGLLEKKVMKEIKDLVARDEGIMLRETLIFSAIAQASVSQAQIFVPLVKHNAKATLNSYVNHASKVVKAIQKDAVNVHGEQMKAMLNNLEGAANAVYGKFGDALVEGNFPAFMDYVLSFGNTEKPKLVKKKPAKKAKDKEIQDLKTEVERLEKVEEALWNAFDKSEKRSKEMESEMEKLNNQFSALKKKK